MTSSSKRSKGPSATGTQALSTNPPGEPRLVDIIHVVHDPRIRREYIEMVLFVLVLVCFLRMFGAEAYVIPSGSMAPTLLGANKIGTCPECGHMNLVNARGEAEDNRIVNEGLCQNCQHPLEFARGGFSPGDRILVDKLEVERRNPDHWQVAVFKFPDGVQRNPNGQVRSARTNYIKRVIGTPGETVGIQYGDIFLRAGDVKENDFRISRKPERVVMATRRLVWNHDQPAADLLASGFPERWAPADQNGWAEDPDERAFSLTGDRNGWLEYRHFLRRGITGEEEPTRHLISDFETYNTDNFHRAGFNALGENWVGDLMIECDLSVESDSGIFTLELVDGVRVYHLEFDIKTGKGRILSGDEEVAAFDHGLSKGSHQQVRFSDFDDRLLVWVSGSLITPAEGIDLPVPTREERGPRETDLRPARIGGKDGFAGRVSSLKLFRDIYYTKGGEHIVRDVNEYGFLRINLPSEIDRYRERLLDGGMRTFSVGAHEFFVMGDNSPHSADARDWIRTNVVDERLLLGRAVARYWPMIRFNGYWPILHWKFVE